MTQRHCLFVIIMVGMVCWSCTDEGSITRRIDYIKAVGDTNPQLASHMLDTINGHVRNGSESVNMKYDLLRIRLNDKAYFVATSDSMIKILLDYYERHGNDREKQEVYYYAGSVYRDLNDTPRSLEYFLKAEETAERDDDCDSVMLKNTFSNLSYLYYTNMLDRADAYSYAVKEYNISRQMGKMDFACLMHYGESLYAVDSVEQAHKIYTYIVDTIYSTPRLCDNAVVLAKMENNIQTLSCLLRNLSMLNDTVNAMKCSSLLEKAGIGYESNYVCQAYGYYYDLLGETDSSVYAFKRVLICENNQLNKYAAAETLFKIYQRLGQTQEAVKYAAVYVSLSDTLDLGLRQKLSFTTHNRFKYSRDKSESLHIIDENVTLKSILVFICILALVIVLFIAYRKYKHIIQVKSLKQDARELMDATRKLHAEKERLQVKIEQLNTKIEEAEEKYRILFNMRQQSINDGVPKDLVVTLHEASSKGLRITDEQESRVIEEVNSAYPLFAQQMLKDKEKYSETQFLICYLMRLGLSKNDIQNLTNVSRSTIWRYYRTYSWQGHRKECDYGREPT